MGKGKKTCELINKIWDVGFLVQKNFKKILSVVNFTFLSKLLEDEIN